MSTSRIFTVDDFIQSTWPSVTPSIERMTQRGSLGRFLSNGIKFGDFLQISEF